LTNEKYWKNNRKNKDFITDKEINLIIKAINAK